MRRPPPLQQPRGRAGAPRRTQAQPGRRAGTAPRAHARRRARCARARHAPAARPSLPRRRPRGRPPRHERPPRRRCGRLPPRPRWPRCPWRCRASPCWQAPWPRARRNRSRSRRTLQYRPRTQGRSRHRCRTRQLPARCRLRRQCRSRCTRRARWTRTRPPRSSRQCSTSAACIVCQSNLGYLSMNSARPGRRSGDSVVDYEGWLLPKGRYAVLSRCILAHGALREQKSVETASTFCSLDKQGSRRCAGDHASSPRVRFSNKATEGEAREVSGSASEPRRRPLRRG